LPSPASDLPHGAAAINKYGVVVYRVSAQACLRDVEVHGGAGSNLNEFAHASLAFGAAETTPAGIFGPNSVQNNSSPFTAAELSSGAAIGYTRTCACGGSPVTVTLNNHGRMTLEIRSTVQVHRGVANSGVSSIGLAYPKGAGTPLLDGVEGFILASRIDFLGFQVGVAFRLADQ
jgi:hypothetical protein